MQRVVEEQSARANRSLRAPLTLNHRERWNRTMHFQTVDRLPHEEFGYWAETLPTWGEQGLPAGIATEEQADRFFGFDPRRRAPVRVGLWPGFQVAVLEETDRYQIRIDGEGVKSIVHKSGRSSIPQYLEFPVQDRRSWRAFKKRLDPATPERYPSDWTERTRAWQRRDYALGVSTGSLFGWLRNWMGIEGVSMALYDDPSWVHEMMDHLTHLVLQTLERAVTEVEFDFAHFWEDMCCNHGPLISPAMFSEFLTPRYRQITAFLQRRGIDVFVVDCDGDINDLVPLWLEGGVNCMFPLERRSGTDPVALRRRFGEAVLLAGGVDKIQLQRGKREIDAEIRRLEPLMAAGGYIPHVDHRVPPDVPYENYLYYLEVKRKAIGL